MTLLQDPVIRHLLIEGKHCQTYLDSDWCTSNGEYGNEWGNYFFDENAVYLWDKEWNDWGTFELYSDNGQSASLCPQCGCSPGNLVNYCNQSFNHWSNP